MARTIKQQRTEFTELSPEDWLIVQRNSDNKTGKAKQRVVFGGGWATLSATPDTITDLGNGSQQLVFNNVDYTSILSAGMKLRGERSVTAPTACFSLDGSNDYFNDTTVSGMSFTDDFCVGAWIKLSAYPASNFDIVSRMNGTSGWRFYITSNGTISLIGYNASAANYSQVTSYRSIPLNRWVFVAAQLDMSSFTTTSTTSYIMIDRKDVPCAVSRGGTNPTALVQAGDLNIGSYNSGTGAYSGKVDQVAIYSAKVTQAVIASSATRPLTGSETSLVSAYGNGSVTDLNTTNANNLTAQNGATAGATDAPFSNGSGGTYDYGILQTASYSTNTTVVVQMAEGNSMPTSGGLATIAYSTQEAPYGFPTEEEKFLLQTIFFSTIVQAAVTSGTFYNPTGLNTKLPIGKWNVGGTIMLTMTGSTTADKDIYTGITTSSSALSDPRFYRYVFASGHTVMRNSIEIQPLPMNVSTETTLYLGFTGSGAGTLTNLGLNTTSMTCINMWLGNV